MPDYNQYLMLDLTILVIVAILSFLQLSGELHHVLALLTLISVSADTIGCWYLLVLTTVAVTAAVVLPPVAPLLSLY